MKIFKTLMCLLLTFAIFLVPLSGTPIVLADTPTLGEADGPPGSDVVAFGDIIDENGFFKGVKALDCIEMFNYKGLEIPYDAHRVPEQELLAKIISILSMYADPEGYNEQIMDRAVIAGDTVNIDYVGSVGGVEVKAISTEGKGSDVKEHSIQYIDDFYPQIIGHMPGETFNVNIKFPDDYPFSAELAGKDALFVTTINYIVNTNYTMSDAFVKENLFKDYGWTTLKEMRASIEEDLRKDNISKYIDKYISGEVTVLSMPDQAVQYQEKMMLDYYMELAYRYGVELDQMLEGAGYSSVDELNDDNYETNYQNAVGPLVLVAIAEDGQLSVSDGDIAKYFQDYDLDYASYVEQYGLPAVKHMVLCQKAFDYIVDHAIPLPAKASLFPFKDVKTSDWFYLNVYNMWDNELMNGTSDTMFSPNTTLTRGMVVTVLWRMRGAPDVADIEMPFNDVADPGSWYYNAVKWASGEGIVTGYEDGTFKPNDTIYRQDLALILNRYAGFAKIGLSPVREYASFGDDAQIGAYAKDAVETLYKSGVINGKSGNSFDPRGNATRAEFAAMLDRVLEK